MFVKHLQEHLAAVYRNWGGQDRGEYFCISIAYRLIESILLHEENYNLSFYNQNMKDIEMEKITVLSPQYQRILKRFKDYIMQKSVIPPLRTYILNNWDPLDEYSDNLVEFLENWQNLCSQECLEQVFEQLIIPKLQSQLQISDFSKCKILPHMWLQPWILVIKEDKLIPLWFTLTSKLSNFLQNWEDLQFSFKIIKPWRNILTQQVFEQIINRCIVPKLLYEIQMVVIDPSDQLIGGVKKVLDWVDVLDDNQILMVFQPFIEKLYDVYIDWIQDADCQKIEVYKCLNGWVSILGDRICQNEHIKIVLNDLYDQIQ